MALFGSGERRIRPTAGTHMWHGPLRVRELCGRHAVRLEVLGTPYRSFGRVHISKLKRVKTYPDRPRKQLNVEEADHLDFDEALLPEDSNESTLDEDEFESRGDNGCAVRKEDPFWKNPMPVYGTRKGSGDPT